ncbi:MAG TPA: S8 family serine peptidase, partial [Blastocatellia bacterium]|nr:S8 family serine peptidase [Blastocatellia bacterium]
FRRGALDTAARRDLDTSAGDLDLPNQLSTASAGGQKRTRVIQFAGPIKGEWAEWLRQTGVEIIAYIPNNAYIIRGAPISIAEVASMNAGELADAARPIRWMGRFEGVQKLDPVFTHDLLASRAAVDVEIELVESPETVDAIERIRSLAASINQEPRKFLNYVALRVTLPVQSLAEIADLDEVMFISPAPPTELHDERSAQIAAGNLAEGGAQPSGPSYKAWLESKGLYTPSDFVIDFTDSGLERGSTLSTLVHPDFRDSQGQSRVAYVVDYTRDDRGDDRSGHGSIVASVASGLGSADRKDAAGYMYGIGVDPAARIGASRIFDYLGRLPFRLSFTNLASEAYAAGARISNNSWGNGTNSYDVTAQEYDALARDAQPSVAGNQEMTFIFSAGNGGAGGRISSPGVAKNVISVAASENFRPEGFDSCDLDGQGAIGPDGADNAMDILRYSAGGPTLDGRAKPDIAAPGTHVYGVASKAQFFSAAGLCPGIPVYQPPGQDLYTWSSGTSLAAPHITGAASLIRKFFTLRNLLGEQRPPSPAMTKAFLINSALYMTGENASGDLPSERQGWGRVNLARAFDDAKRALIDQTRLFTESGQVFEIEGSLADRSRGLRVTLALTDAPGALAGAATVNDLDLEVVIGGVSVYRGNVFNGPSSIEGGEADRLNNV